MDFCGLSQFNRTKNHNNVTLDLVLSNVQPENIRVTRSNASLVDEDLHHPTLQILLDTSVSYQEEKKFRFFNYRRRNYDAVNSDISDVDWNFIDQLPINESTDRFYDIVNEIIAKHIPRCTTRRKYPAWYTFELINLIGKKSIMHAKWKRTKNQDDYSKFSRLRTAVKELSTTCHLNYMHNLQLNITKNIKFFWAYTKSKRKTNSYPSEFTFNDARSSEPQEICQMFSNFFESTYNNKPLRANQTLTVANMTTSSRPITNIQFSVERVSKLLA